MLSTRDSLMRALHSRAIVYPELNTNLFVTGDTFISQDLSYLQLRCAVLDGCKFTKCDFDMCMVQGVSFQHAIFEQCSFNNVDAGRGITILGAQFKNTTFKNILGDWNFSDSKLTDCSFTKLDGALVVFDRGTELTACDIAEIDIEAKHDARMRTDTTKPFKPWPEDVSEDEAEESDEESNETVENGEEEADEEEDEEEDNDEAEEEEPPPPPPQQQVRQARAIRGGVVRQ